MTRRERLMARAIWLDLGLALLLAVTLVPALRAAGWTLAWMVGASVLTGLSYRAQFLAADELGRQCLIRSLAAAGVTAILGLVNLVVWGMMHGGALPLMAVWAVVIVALVVHYATLWWWRRGRQTGA